MFGPRISPSKGMRRSVVRPQTRSRDSPPRCYVRHVRCTVLGPVTVDGVEPGSPLERRLLAVLLANRGIPVSVDRLTDVVWNGAPPRASLNALQSKISRLRRRVGLEHLRRIGDGYVLALPANACDADRFRDLVDASDGADPATRVAVLDEALALWRGTAFDQYAEEDFARPVAVGLEQARLGAHERRLQALLDLRRYEAVLDATEELIDADPFREPFWMAKMHALALAGRSIDASRCYRTAYASFVDETGIPPSSAMAALEHAIVNGEVESRPGAIEVAAKSNDDGRTEPRSRSDPRTLPSAAMLDEASSRVLDRPPATPRFLGAVAARGAVDRALDRLLATGRPAFIDVTGASGLGKSRLLDATTSRARTAGVRVLGARYIPDVDLPFGWLGQVAATLGLAERTSDRSAGELPRHLDVRLDDSSSISQLVLRLLDRLSEEPTLIVVDDLQWAEPSDAAALDLLVNEVEIRAENTPSPLLVVAAHQPLDPSSVTHAVVGRLSRRACGHSVTLVPLDEAGVAAIVQACTGIRPSGATSMLVHEMTGGNPAEIEELLRGWYAEGRLVIQSGCLDVEGVDVPQRTSTDDDALGERWAQLDDSTQAALLVLASSPLLNLLDPPMVTSVLAGVLDVPPGSVLSMFDSAVAHDILTGSGRPRFASWTTRELVRKRAGRSEQVRLLGRLASELTDVKRTADGRTLADRYPALLVYTLEAATAAGAPIADDELVRAAIAAGETSLRVGAWHESVHHLDIAVRRSPPNTPLRLSDGSAAVLALGMAMFRSHDEHRAQAVLVHAADRAAAEGDLVAEGLALTAVHRIAISFSHERKLPVGPDGARELLLEFVDRTRDVEPNLASRACAVLAEDAAVRGDGKEAGRLVELAESRVSGADRSAHAAVHFAAGLTSLASLALEEAERRLSATTRDAIDAGDRWIASWGAGRLVLVHLLTGDHAATAASIERALELQYPIRIWSELSLTRALQAADAARRGRTDDALAHAEDADHLATRSGYPFGRQIATPVEACVLAGIGRFDEARETLRRLDRAQGQPAWPLEAIVDVATGDAEAGWERVDARIERLPSIPTLNWLPAIAATALVAAAVGDDTMHSTIEPHMNWLREHGVRVVPQWPSHDVSSMFEPASSS